LAAHGVPMSIVNLGLPDRFIEHATRAEMLQDAALDARGVVSALRRSCSPYVSYSHAAA
jgi:1-deoxy-D-xylulose-5-phosphate synthase